MPRNDFTSSITTLLFALLLCNLVIFTYSQSTAQRAHLLINEERVKKGLSALVGNQELYLSAQRHADDMSKQGYLDHTGRDGSSFVTRAERAGYTAAPAAENIARGQNTPASVVAGWMNSTGHRGNILSSSTEIGVGYASNGNYWVTVFGIRTPGCGNGVAESNEGCDDGNLKNDDGCSDKCEVEDGYSCQNKDGIFNPTSDCSEDGLSVGEQAAIALSVIVIVFALVVGLVVGGSVLLWKLKPELFYKIKGTLISGAKKPVNAIKDRVQRGKSIGVPPSESGSIYGSSMVTSQA